MTAAYDLLSPAFFADPYPVFARMRQHDPLYWYEDMGVWFATRHQDVRTIIRDARFSTARVDAFMPAGTDDKTQAVRQFYTDWMLFSDPPEHTRLRKLAARAFTPRSIAALEPFIHRTVKAALDRVAGQDQIDILGDFGFPVPSRVIAHMLGVAPDRVGDFKRWSDDIMRIPSLLGDPEENFAVSYRAICDLEAYFRELIAERRAAPTGDLLSLLVHASEDGTMLAEHEVIAQCVLLLTAGHETTTNLIGNATLALLRNPGELARLRAQPGLMAQAVEEFLRYDGPVAATARQATEDVTLSSGGVVPAGAVVMAVMPSANRDPAVFTDPDRLDLGRDDARHIAFGFGPHACIGLALARLEARIALTALLARYPRLELAVSEPSPIVSWSFRGVTSLPVTVS
jgi:cytochrome P450